MNTDRIYFEWFCRQVQTSLEQSSINKMEIIKGTSQWTITGCLQQEDLRQVPCTIQVPENWQINRPLVWAEARWLKSGINWHRFDRNGAICYALDKQWLDTINYLKNEFSFIDFSYIASQWLIDSVKLVLEAHLYAYKYDKHSWPDGFPGWDHDYKKALQQYLKKTERNGAVEIIYPQKNNTEPT